MSVMQPSVKIVGRKTRRLAISGMRIAVRPALLHLKLDPQALTPNASLDALRAQGLAAKHR